MVKKVTRRRALLTCAGVTLTSVFAGCFQDERSPVGASNGRSTPTETPTPTSRAEPPTDTSEEPATETLTDESTPEETTAETEEPETDSERGNRGEGWYVQPASWTAATPEELVCENDDATRVGQGFDESELVWGDGEAWEMRISETAVSHDDTVRIRLENVTEDTRSLRAHSLYNVQVETESGWQDVRTYESRDEWGVPTGILRHHEPGESYEWTLTLTEAELADDVCPPLQDGRYRFVFYGFQDASDRPIGVGFNFNV